VKLRRRRDFTNGKLDSIEARSHVQQIQQLHDRLHVAISYGESDLVTLDTCLYILTSTHRYYEMTM
jgi:hypothetical protein